MGLVRRRHFILRGRTLTGLDDELLTAEPTGADLVLVGEGALLAALERSRSGRMADIVATIQREQDEIVRSPLAGIVVVQGGPGTGKTAVALHRAAYLLYTFRFPLERAGVLLIGPSRIFLRYIEQVLPALGEHTRQPGHPRRPGAHARPGRRHPRGGPPQGRGPHGHASSPRPSSTGSGACPSPSACCGTASACACRSATPAGSSRGSGAAGAPTTNGGRSWSGRWCAISWAS